MVLSLTSFVLIGKGLPSVSCSPIEGILCLLFELQYDVYVTFFLRTIPKFILLTMAISVFICVYTAMGMFLFDPNQLEAQLYFTDYGVAVWNMLMLLNSASWPGPFVPALVTNRFFVTYFYAYLVIVGWGLLNLLLGFNYFFFETEVNIVYERQEAKRINNKAEAFRILDIENKGFLTYEQVDVLLQEMYEYYESVHDIPSCEERYELIASLDSQNTQRIDENDFDLIEERCFQDALKTNRAKKRKFTRYISANIIKKQSVQLVKLQSEKIRHATASATAAVGRRFGRDGVPTTVPSATTTDGVTTYNVITTLQHDASRLNASADIAQTGRSDVDPTDIDKDNSSVSTYENSFGGAHPMQREESTLNRQASLIGRAAEYSGRQDGTKAPAWYKSLAHKHITELNRERGRALYRFASHAAIQVDSVIFDICADVVIGVVGVAVLCLEYRLDLAILYNILTLGEMLLKAWVKGVHRYLRSGRNTIDWKIAVGLFVLIILDACLEPPNHTHVIIKTLVLLRTLLLPRNLIATNGFKNFRRHQRMALAYAFKSMDHLIFLLVVLAVMIYVFASIGQEIFGGTVRRDDPAVQLSSYGQLQYWPLNFNDIPSGMVTMFTLLSVNNMNVTASGFVAALSEWAEVFFALWYAFGVLFLLDVVTALFLSQYIAYLEHKTIEKRAAADEAAQKAAQLEQDEENECGFETTFVHENVLSNHAPEVLIKSSKEFPVGPLLHEDSLGNFDVPVRKSVNFAARPLPKTPIEQPDTAISFTSTSAKRLRKVVQFLVIDDDAEARADEKEAFSGSFPTRSARFSCLLPSVSSSKGNKQREGSARVRSLPHSLASPMLNAQTPAASRQRLSRRLSSRFSIRSDSGSDSDIEPDDLLNVQAINLDEPNQINFQPTTVGFQESIFSDETGRAKLQDWMKEKRKSTKIRRDNPAAPRAIYSASTRDPVVAPRGSRSFYNVLSGRYRTTADGVKIAPGAGNAYSPLWHEVKNPIHGPAVRPVADGDTKVSDSDGANAQIDHETVLAQPPPQSFTDWFYNEDQVTPVEEAAVLLQGAIDGEDPELFTSRRGLWCFQKRTQYAAVFRVCSMLYLFLKVFQRPMWTYTHSDWNHHTFYPVSGVPLLAPQVTCALNVPLLLVMFLGVLLEVGYQNANFISICQNFTNARAMRCALLLYNLAQLISAFCCVAGGPPQLALFSSTGGILYMMWFGRRSLRKFASVLQVLPRLLKVLAVYMVMVFLMAGVGLFLYNLDEVGKDDDVAADYFADFSTATWSLLMAMCTTSYPNQIMPAYQEYREFSLFIFVFVALGSLIMLKVMLVVVFVEYQKASSHSTDLRRAVRQVLVMASFDALDSTHQDSIDRSQAAAFLNELHAYYPAFKNTASIEGNMRDAFLSHLDTDLDGCIYVEDFWNILEIVQTKLPALPQLTFMELWFPEVVKSQAFRHLRNAVLFPYFNVIVDCVLAALMIANMIARAGHLYEASPVGTGLSAAQVSIMLAECCAKVLVRGWARYRRSFRNQLDCSVLMVALATVIGAATYPGVSGFTLLLRVSLMCRFFWLPRNIRYVFESKRVKNFAKLCRRIADKTLTLSVVLACLIYAFSSIGMFAFGGQINRDPNGPHYAELMASRYAADGYWPLNFNDFTSSLIVVFSCLNVGDFDIFAEAFVITTGLSARLYFIAWYVLGTLLMLNIIKSYFLVEFLTIFTAATAKEAEEQSKKEQLHVAKAESAKPPASHALSPRHLQPQQEHKEGATAARDDGEVNPLVSGAAAPQVHQSMTKKVVAKSKIDRTPQWS